MHPEGAWGCPQAAPHPPLYLTPMCEPTTIALIGTALLSANVQRNAQKNAAKDQDRMQKEAEAAADKAAADAQAATDAKVVVEEAKATEDAKKATRTFLFQDDPKFKEPSQRRSLRLFDDRESLASPTNGASGGSKAPTLGI